MNPAGGASAGSVLIHEGVHTNDSLYPADSPRCRRALHHCSVQRGVRSRNLLQRCLVRARAISASTRGVSEDLYRLPSCGREGYQAAGELFSRARVSHDTSFLRQLLRFVSGGDGLLLLDPLLTVAEDRRATTEARVTAMVGLIQLQSGVNAITFHDLSVGTENTTCGVGRMVTDQGGHPKTTSADSARIVAIAKQIRADPTAPVEVRTGAVCLGG